jgi:hypothetical protein
MSEIEKLLLELQNMKKEGKNIPNNSTTWAKLGAKDWQGAGFDSEEEAKQWILDNPYANL